MSTSIADITRSMLLTLPHIRSQFTKDFQLNANKLYRASKFFTDDPYDEDTPWVYASLAGLAIQIEHRLFVHYLEGDVLDLISTVIAEYIPDEPPTLLKQAFIIESKDGSELINGFTQVGGFPFNDSMILIGSHKREGLMAMVAGSFWGYGAYDFETEINKGDAELADLPENLLKWVITLGLLLEEERMPVLSVAKTTKEPQPKDPKNLPPWVTRTIYLSKSYKTQESDLPEPSQPELPAPPDLSQPNDPDKEFVETYTKEHWRHQACGPGFSERKWVKIKRFKSHKKLSKRPTKIIVKK